MNNILTSNFWLSSPYAGSRYMDILLNVCPTMFFLVIAHTTYLMYFKKSKARTIVIDMFYSWPPMTLLIIAAMFNWEASAFVGGVMYIICLYAIKKTFKQIEEHEQKGVTAYLTKDIKPQELEFAKMSAEEKDDFYISLKKPKVNIWVFTALFWGIPIIGMILFQLLTGQKYF
jgi:hypothetical protein